MTHMTRNGISTSPSSGKYLALALAWFSRKSSTLVEFKLEWHMYATFTIFIAVAGHFPVQTPVCTR
jgi:hypothetical protein